MKYLNLEKIIGDDKSLNLGGKKLIIPGEIPVKIMFRLIKASQDIAEDYGNIDKINVSYEVIRDILVLKNHDVNPDWVYEQLQELTTKQYAALVNYIHGNDENADEEEKPELKKTQGDVILVAM
jgi:hypothetical protein